MIDRLNIYISGKASLEEITMVMDGLKDSQGLKFLHSHPSSKQDTCDQSERSEKKPTVNIASYPEYGIEYPT